MLVDAINHRRPSAATPSTVEGPFHVPNAPAMADGGDMAQGAPGIPCFLTGKVRGPVTGDAKTDGGLRFSLHNIKGDSPVVPIVYRGSVPDLFKVGRDVNLTGHLEDGSFVAHQMTTKCPSKYTATPNNKA